jgi:hypothetical protein
VAFSLKLDMTFSPSWRMFMETKAERPPPGNSASHTRPESWLPPGGRGSFQIPSLFHKWQRKVKIGRGFLIKTWAGIADYLPNSSLITKLAKTADMISISSRGVCGRMVSHVRDRSRPEYRGVRQEAIRSIRVDMVWMLPVPSISAATLSELALRNGTKRAFWAGFRMRRVR